MNEWMFIHYQYISIPICVLGVELETQWQRMAAWHSTPLYATDPHIEVSLKGSQKARLVIWFVVSMMVNSLTQNVSGDYRKHLQKKNVPPISKTYPKY